MTNTSNQGCLWNTKVSHYKQVGRGFEKKIGDTALTADYNNIAKTKNTGMFNFILNIQKSNIQNKTHK